MELHQFLLSDNLAPPHVLKHSQNQACYFLWDDQLVNAWTRQEAWLPNHEESCQSTWPRVVGPRGWSGHQALWLERVSSQEQESTVKPEGRKWSEQGIRQGGVQGSGRTEARLGVSSSSSRNKVTEADAWAGMSIEMADFQPDKIWILSVIEIFRVPIIIASFHDGQFSPNPITFLHWIDNNCWTTDLGLKTLQLFSPDEWPQELESPLPQKNSEHKSSMSAIYGSVTIWESHQLVAISRLQRDHFFVKCFLFPVTPQQGFCRSGLAINL